MGRFDKNRFRTENQSWETPDTLFSILNSEFHFEIDLAASKENRKCILFFSETDNGLSKTWNGIGWLNPPYGGTKENAIKNWVKKAFDETRKDGCVVVMLIPARTNTEWWHNYCMKAKEIRFIRGRPKFKGNIHGLPQPLAIVVFQKTNNIPLLKTQEQKETAVKPIPPAVKTAGIIGVIL